jgi:hypothetical protein
MYKGHTVIDVVKKAEKRARKRELIEESRRQEGRAPRAQEPGSGEQDAAAEGSTDSGR